MSKPKVRYDKDTSKKVFGISFLAKKRTILKFQFFGATVFFHLLLFLSSQNVVKVFIISKAPNPGNKSAIKIFDGTMKTSLLTLVYKSLGSSRRKSRHHLAHFYF